MTFALHDQPIKGHPSETGLDLVAALRDCGTGDTAALRRIYDQEAPRMIGVAMRILRRRDVAEDVVHDAFLRIWRNAQSYNPMLGPPRAWIYTIVRHLAIDVLRSSAREDLVDESQLTDMADSAIEAAAVFDKLAEGSALRRCLERLEPKRRASLLLAYANGCSHGEIAGKLGVPLGTVKAWIRRSLVALRECLA